MLEPTVDVDAGVYAPDSVSESLYGLELVPLRGLCVVHLESNILADLVGSSTYDHHEWAEEQGRVLVAGSRSLTRFVGCLDPVPSAVAVAAKPPSIAEGGLVGRSSSEANHHAGGTACLTECCAMIDPRRWLFFATIEFVPRERCPLNAEAPDIIHWLLSGVTTEHEEVWLGEDDGVAVSTPWRRAYNWHNHPLGHFLAISHIE